MQIVTCMPTRDDLRENPNDGPIEVPSSAFNMRSPEQVQGLELIEDGVQCVPSKPKER